MRIPHNIPHPYRPEDLLSEEIHILPGAVVVPHTRYMWQPPTGVLDAQMHYSLLGATNRYRFPITRAPEPRQPEAQLSGTWLWGGLLFDHFGHFFTESITRFWAGHGDASFDGICFTPMIPERGHGLLPFQREGIDLFGLPHPVQVVMQPTRVERLIVPGQGFGLGRLACGTPAMRHVLDTVFAADIAPDGPEAIYVSRSRLSNNFNVIVGEDRIEAHLAAEGYTIIHPQTETVARQIALYKVAKRLIFADGSAVHLLGHVLRPDQRIGYITRSTRRRGGAWPVLTLRNQRRYFDPALIYAPAHEWDIPKDDQPNPLVFMQPDLPQVQAQLIAADLINPGPQWPAIKGDMARKYLEQNGLLEQAFKQEV